MGAEPRSEYPELQPDGGIDAHSAPEKVELPRHLNLEDAHHDQPGACNVRRGYAALSNDSRAGSLTGDVAAAHGLMSDGEALLLAADGVYTGAAYARGVTEWELTDFAGQFPVTTAFSLFDATRVQRVEMARVQEYYCIYARTDDTTSASTEHRFAIVRDADNVVVRAGFFNATVSGSAGSTDGCQPKLVATSGRFWWFFVDGTNLKYMVYDPTDNTTDWVVATAFGSVHGTRKNIDAWASGSRVFVAYNHTNGMAVARFTASFSTLTVNVNDVTTHAGNYGSVLAITAPPAAYVAVARYNGGTVTQYSLNESTLALVDSNTIESGITATLCELCLLAYAATVEYLYTPCTVAYTLQLSGVVGLSTAITKFWRADLAGGSHVQGTTINGAYLTRKPVRARGSDFWALARTLGDGGASSEWLTADYRWAFGSSPSAGRVGGTRGWAIVAQLNALGTAPRNKNWYGIAGSIVEVDANADRYDMPSYEAITHGGGGSPLSNVSAAIGSRVRLTRLDLRPHKISSFVLDRQLFVGGSYPRRWSRDLLREGNVDQARGFQAIVPPMQPNLPALVQTTGGALDLLAQYTYCVTEEFVGPDGRRSQSAPSEAVSITLTGANNAVTVDLTNFMLSANQEFSEPSMSRNRSDGHQWAIWRTLGNATDAIFYRTAVAKTADLSFLDQNDDDDIATNEILYTVGGELDNQAPPPSLAMFAWKDRIVCLHAETGELWPSKSWDASEVGGWNIALAVQTNVWSGLPKYACAIDDKIGVWWDDAIGVVYGEPPSDTGEGGTLAPPLLIKRGLGLREASSVVETPDAIFFRSHAGIHALGRDLSVVYVGRDVTELLPDTDCMGAVYLEERNEVRFAFAELTLVYHLERKTWAKHLFGPEPGGEFSRPNIGVAIEHDGAMAVGFSSVAPGGNDYVWRDNDVFSTLDPHGSRPLLTQSTGWIKVGGTFGQQRVRKLMLIGMFDASATMRVYYDYGAAIVETKAGFGTAVAGQQVVVRLSREDCHAVRLEIRGHQRLVAIRAEHAPERGIYERTRTEV